MNVRAERKWSDEEILSLLRKGGPGQNEAFAALYRSNLHLAEGLIRKNGGSREDAKDIFQEAIVVLYRHVREGRFRGESKLSVYLYSICKYLWLNERRKKQKKEAVETGIDDLPGVESTDLSNPEQILEKRERRSLLIQLLQKLGEQCKEVLTYSMYYAWSMEEVAEKMEYSSAQVARNKKYRCLKKLNSYIQSNASVSGMVKDFRH